MKVDSSKSIGVFRRDALHLSIEEFCAKHGDFFLVYDPKDHELEPTPYDDRDAYKGTHEIPPVDQILAPRLSKLGSIRVYPLGVGATEARVGRTGNNDVCIDDVSVSSRHALFQIRDRDRIYIADIGSRNGTELDGVKLEFGDSHRVLFGKNISFGSVQLTLLRAEQFTDVVFLMSSDNSASQ